MRKIITAIAMSALALPAAAGGAVAGTAPVPEALAVAMTPAAPSERPIVLSQLVPIPGWVNPGSQGVYPGSPGRVNPGSQGRVNPGSQRRVNPGSQGRVNPGSQGKTNSGSQGWSPKDCKYGTMMHHGSLVCSP